MKGEVRTSTLILLGVLLIAIVSAAVVSSKFGFKVSISDAAFTMQKAYVSAFPSADKAYATGLSYFSGGPSYDIDKAEYFFKQAVVLEPNYPYVHHQLARIAFLRGEFALALEEINREIEYYGDKHPNAYYVRGLIQGFAGKYGKAAADFERFIKLKPDVWAGYNDYGWTLLKSKRLHSAVKMLKTAVARFPDNAWLLNSYAIALYEVADTAGALDVAERAVRAASVLTAEEWSKANPGNDPAIGKEGLEAFQRSTQENVQSIKSGTMKTVY